MPQRHSESEQNMISKLIAYFTKERDAGKPLLALTGVLETITTDPFSSEICEKCVNKLRVSYHFLGMCKKSTKLIRGYIGKLTETEELEESNNNNDCSEFETSELNIEIEKLPPAPFKSETTLDYDDVIDHNEVYRDADVEEAQQQCTSLSTTTKIVDHSQKYSGIRKKQRITKEQRCSLLKQLLNRPKKERDKSKSSSSYDAFACDIGGLKKIIDFTKNYEFSFSLDKNCNIESTPLDKLTAFSTNYFTRDFSDFKAHILHVIENNRHNVECGSTFGSDDEQYLSGSDMEDDEESDEGGEQGFEEVLVEPDIKVKREILDCDDEDSRCPLDYLETSFEEDSVIKVKREEDLEDDSLSHNISANLMANFYHGTTRIKEEQNHHQFDDADASSTTPLGYKSSLCLNSSPAVKLLDRLVSTYPLGSRKIFSASNVRCRTRDQPYINPMLKNQFLYRSFKCERCNRYFKSQGYLKAHTSKVH